MRLWLGQVISVAGSGMTGFALGVLVFRQTGSATLFAMITVCTTLPGILIAPFAGVLADRYNRRLVMIVADTGSALATLAVAARRSSSSITPVP
jgi:MFS family permease